VTTPTRQQLALNVIMLRSTRRITQGELCKRTGLNRRTIYHIERATGSTRLDTIELLARAFDLTVVDLLRPNAIYQHPVSMEER
jgi:DNA-binding XRE family transcriptional regulator